MRSSAAYRVVALARPGGTGYQDDAVRLVDDLVHDAIWVRGVHAQRSQFDATRLLVEQAQHHALAMS